jgi:long-chain acyl-CoA synthetase
MIVTGAGVNVYPDELEATLNKTAGVKESCVIGLEKGGAEEVHAVLLLDGSGVTPEVIIGQANSQLDALQKITGFTVWKEAEFPKTTTLKIKKFAVKEVVEKGAENGGKAVSGDSLLNLIAKVTETGVAQIREESLLVTELGLTSIGRVEMVNALEQEYRLDIEDGQIGPETKVSDLRQMVAKREKLVSHDHFRFWTNAGFFRGVRMVWDTLFHGPLFRRFVILDVQGLDELKKLSGPVFFVANHMSYLDHLAVMFALPRQLRYRTATAAWEEFFFGDYNGVGRILRRLSYEYASVLFNIFPLPQSQGFSRSLAYMGRLADAGYNILIFPEGEHSRDGKMLPFQQGLGVMVKEVGIPVVPIKIRGTDQVFPHDARIPKRGRVTVTFGEAVCFRTEEPSEIVATTRYEVEKL